MTNTLKNLLQFEEQTVSIALVKKDSEYDQTLWFNFSYDENAIEMEHYTREIRLLRDITAEYILNEFAQDENFSLENRIMTIDGVEFNVCLDATIQDYDHFSLTGVHDSEYASQQQTIVIRHNRKKHDNFTEQELNLLIKFFNSTNCVRVFGECNIYNVNEKKYIKEVKKAA